MDRLRKITQYTKVALMDTFDSGRIVVVAAFVSMIMFAVYGCIGNYLRQQDMVLSVFELLPVILNDGRVSAIVICGFVLVICDVPHTSGNGILYLTRGSKLCWMVGQVFYILVTSVIYVAFLWGIAVLSTFPKFMFKKQWSEAFKYIYYNPHKIDSYWGINVAGTYDPDISALSVFVKCVFLYVMLFAVMGMICMLFNYMSHNVTGYLIIGLFICADQCTGLLNDIFQYRFADLARFSVVTLARSYSSQSVGTVGDAVWVYIIIMLISCIATTIVVRKSSVREHVT